MKAGYFITGTDTGVGKTTVACALLHAYGQLGHKTLGIKPVATGCEPGKEGLRCPDVLELLAASSGKASHELINPYPMALPVAPHIAARRAGFHIDLSVIRNRFGQAQQRAEIVVVEGIGGLKVPLNAAQDTVDLALLLKLPLILVVGMRLGCLNHALLTVQAIKTSGLSFAGWVANQIDPAMIAFRENLEALTDRIDAPLLGVILHKSPPDIQAIAAHLLISRLDLPRPPIT